MERFLCLICCGGDRNVLSPGMIVSDPRLLLFSLVRIVGYKREKSRKFFGRKQKEVGWLAHRADLVGGNGVLAGGVWGL